MTKLPIVRPRDVLAALEAAGFTIVRTKGSHHQLRHAKSGRRVTVPFHNRDLTRATLASILDQAGLTTDAFLRLL